MRLTELPAEAFADKPSSRARSGLRSRRPPQRACRRSLLRPDLPERETAGEAGVWILMPRSAQPRYRRYSRVIAVPVTRQLARAVQWSTAERSSPTWWTAASRAGLCQTEVQLYEALPGTQLGHLAADEAATAGEDTTGELQPLHPGDRRAAAARARPGPGQLASRAAARSPPPAVARPAVLPGAAARRRGAATGPAGPAAGWRSGWSWPGRRRRCGSRSGSPSGKATSCSTSSTRPPGVAPRTCPAPSPS